MYSHIMLATNYNPKNIQFPVALSEKLDGVAVKIEVAVDNTVTATSRQGKPIRALQQHCDLLEEVIEGIRIEHNLLDRFFLVGEITCDTLPDFKDLNGEVRKYEPSKEHVLTVNIYDIYEYSKEGRTASFYARSFMYYSVGVAIQAALKSDVYFRPIKQYFLNTQDDLDGAITSFLSTDVEAEGMMIRPLDGEVSMYKFGRSRGMQKYKVTETVDLIIDGAYEAICIETGEPNGMIGAISARFPDSPELYNIGPGKLTHAERIDLMNNIGDYLGKYIEVAYMPDKTYKKGLREARFVRFRPDKD